MVVVVVDVETTGLSPASSEIIEIGAVRVAGGVVGETFQALVRPSGSIPKDVSLLTGITMDMLSDCPTMEQVLPSFLSFIAGSPLAGHNVSFDLDFLRAACDEHGYDFPASVDALDTRRLGRILLPTSQDFRLQDVREALGVPPQEAHRALGDALTTAHVLCALEAEALELPYVSLQLLERLSSSISPILATWFNEVGERRFTTFKDSLPDTVDSIHQLAFSRPNNGPPQIREQDERDEAGHPSDIRSLATKLLSEDSPIGKFLPGFQVREGQRQMVGAVSDALEGDQHLIAEAGTGTGKSLAYLIPAALYALTTEERVVIATHTIALQDQIRDRDFPTLRTVIPSPLSLAVFKGRTHYVCMRKLWQELRVVGIGWPEEEVEAYMALVVWLVKTPEGNREELGQSGRMNEVWPRVQSETETCINKRCPFFKSCYYFRARQTAFDANVVVTNHSLIMSDLKADHRVLPRYDKLVLDEAHHLEDEATKHLGQEVYLAHCLTLFARLSRDGGRHGVLPELTKRLETTEGEIGEVKKIIEQLTDLLPPLRSHVEEAFHALAGLMTNEQTEFRITPAVENTLAWRQFLASVDQLMEMSSSLTSLLQSLSERAEEETDDDLAGRLLDAKGFIDELFANISILCDAGDIDADHVLWVERANISDRPYVSFHRAPIDVGRILSDALFQNKSSVVLTSATLAVEGRFDYLMARLGMSDAAADGRVASLMVSSPFDIPNQTLLCVPNDIPELAKMPVVEAAAWLSDALYQLARASRGRLLALFTSHALLRATASLVRDPLADRGLELFAQGIDGSRKRILESFRHHPNAVLFGAASFWEGIDLPGDQLTTLVIIRLPFAPPSHPVTAARHERLEQEGKSAFWAASLPEAVVRFRQGFGRLIRTVHDRGVVVVYDKRIVTARYGSTFIKSLQGVRPFVAPEAQIIRAVQQFLHGSEQTSSRIR